MPQFTPESLARVLANVERDVLRDALEIADLWDLISHREREILQAMGLWLLDQKRLVEFDPGLSIEQLIDLLPAPLDYVGHLIWLMLNKLFPDLDFQSTRQEIVDQAVDAVVLSMNEIGSIVSRLHPRYTDNIAEEQGMNRIAFLADNATAVALILKG